MPSLSVSLQTSFGARFDAYLARPAKPNGGGIVVLQEIFGINANMREVADRLGGAGYNAIVPDLFWRQEPSVKLDPKSDLDWKRAVELMQGTDVASAVQDAILAAEYVRSLEGSNGKVGALRFCFGGKLAYFLSMQPQFAIAVSYYGTGLQSVLDQIDRVRSPLLLHIAEEYHLCPPEPQSAIEQAAAWHGDLISVIRYEGAGHAFARVGSSGYNEESATKANHATDNLLRANLVTEPGI